MSVFIETSNTESPYLQLIESIDLVEDELSNYDRDIRVLMRELAISPMTMQEGATINGMYTELNNINTVQELKRSFSDSNSVIYKFNSVSRLFMFLNNLDSVDESIRLRNVRLGNELSEAVSISVNEDDFI